MTSQLPDGAAAYSAWLRDASDEELDEVLVGQVRENPEYMRAFGQELDRQLAFAWSGQVPLGLSVDNEAEFAEVPLDEASFLLAALDSPPQSGAVLRLNVQPLETGSQLEVELVLPGSLRPGVRIRCEYDLDGDGVVLSGTGSLNGLSSTPVYLASGDDVGVRLIIKSEVDEVA